MFFYRIVVRYIICRLCFKCLASFLLVFRMPYSFKIKVMEQTL